MMDITAFIEKFHTLDGRTLGEKQRNLNLLLKNVPADHEQLSLITPQNNVEKFFKLMLLLKLKRTHELVHTLKTEEEYLVVKLLRNKWFCQHLASKLEENSSNFVDDVLPSLSFVIRKRLLTKLATFGTNLDEVFDQTCDRYGLNVATIILVGCSAPKIERVINENNVFFSRRQLKILSQRHPQLLVLYGRKHNFSRIHGSCFKLMAQNDIHYFITLMKETSNVGITFGKRLTRKIMTLYKDFVIANINGWNHCLNQKTIARILTSDELYKFVFNCCGPTLDIYPDFDRGLDYNILESGLGQKYYYFVSKVVKDKYNKSIYDVPELITDTVMETMDVEERQKWIAIKKKKGATEDNMIPYMRINDAISLVKDKVSAASPRQIPEDLVEHLVKACKVNNDLDVLLEVGRYLCGRNDSKSVLTKFLQTVVNLFNLEIFEDHHWEFIDEMLENIDGEYEESTIRYDFYIKKVEFLFRNNKFTDEKILKFLAVFMPDYRWKFQTTIKELNKILLIKAIKFVPKIYTQENWEYVHIELLTHIFTWNKKNPKDRISVLEPSLIKSLRKGMEDARTYEDYLHELGSLIVALGDFICSDEDSEIRKSALDCYFALGQDYYDLGIDFWLVKNQPENLTLSKFLDHLFYGSSRAVALLTYAKRYASLDFQQRIVKCALEIKEDWDTDVVFTALAILEPPELFLEHITPFYPEFDKLEDAENSKSRIGISIAKSFRYVGDPLVFPTLLRYCKGDFMGYALDSLYYLFSHLPEEKLKGFFDKFSSEAVPIRKHALFLACNVGDVALMRDVLKKFTKTEENVYVRKCVLRASLKYFVKNPSEEFWEYVKMSLENLDKNHHVSHRLVANVEQIPEKYQVRYVIFVWDILKKREDFESNSTQLLSLLSPTVYKDFPLDFISTLIKENFLTGNLNDFIVSCLANSQHKSAVMVEIFQIIQCTDFTDSMVAKSLFKFVEVMVRALEKDVGNFDILHLFVEKWTSIFSPVQALREHLKLSFAIFYLEAKKDVDIFSERMTQFLHEIVTKYGFGVFDVFAEETKKCLGNILSSSNEFGSDFYAFCKNVLAKGRSLHRIFVIKLLPSERPTREALEFLQLVQFFQNLREDQVQVLINLYMRDLE